MKVHNLTLANLVNCIVQIGYKVVHALAITCIRKVLLRSIDTGI
jgi:hypothetical protein